MSDTAKRLTYALLTFLTALPWFYGLVSTEILSKPAWSSDGRYGLLWFSLTYFATAAVVTTLAPRYLRSVYLVALVLLTTAVGPAPLIAVSIIVAGSFLLGDWMIRRLRHSSQREEALDFTLSMFLGLAVYISLISGLAHTKINYTVTYTILFLTPFALNASRLHVLKALVISAFAPSKQPAQHLFLKLLVGYFFSLYLVAAIAPESGYDALAMHLALPAKVYDSHYWPFDVTEYIWAVMPMGGDWAYTAAYFLGGELAARLLNLAFLVLLAQALYIAVKRKTSQRTAIAIVLFFLSMPLTYLETTTLFIENIWAGFLFAATLALLRYSESGSRSDFYLLSALSGAAMATKVMTISALPAMALFGAIYLWRYETPKGVPKVLAVSLAIFLTFSLSPYVTAYIQTGNPVFPFFNELFKSPYFAIDANFNNPLFNHSLTLTTLYDATFFSSKYLEASPGALGLHLFVLIPLGVAATAMNRERFAVMALTISATMIVIIFSKQSYLRYIFPTIPLFLLLAGYAIEDIRHNSRWLTRTVASILTLATIFNWYLLPSAGWHNRGFPIAALASPENRESFLNQRVPVRSAIEFINAAYGDSAGVALLTAPYVAKIKGRAFSNTWHSYSFWKNLLELDFEDVSAVYRFFKQYDIDLVVVDGSTDQRLRRSLDQVSSPIYDRHGVVVLRVQDLRRQ